VHHLFLSYKHTHTNHPISLSLPTLSLSTLSSNTQQHPILQTLHSSNKHHTHKRVHNLSLSLVTQDFNSSSTITLFKQTSTCSICCCCLVFLLGSKPQQQQQQTLQHTHIRTHNLSSSSNSLFKHTYTRKSWLLLLL